MNTKIFEDNILSRNDIAVRYVFQKMFSPQGTLVAVECLSRFDNLSISPEDFFRHATAAVRERIFLEQLALIEKHKAWFLRNHISATINVDDHILNLLRQKDIKAKVAALTCVHFEVTENAENLLHNSLAAWQSPQDTSLWLDDFGSGYAGINAIRGYQPGAAELADHAGRPAAHLPVAVHGGTRPVGDGPAGYRRRGAKPPADHRQIL